MSEELGRCPFCGGEALVREGGINGRLMTYGLVEHKEGCFFLADGLPTKNQHIMEDSFDAWNTRHVETCRYIPDVMHSYFDDDDNEVDTDEADPDGCHCSCDRCGCPMLTGEMGWFDESPGEHGGIVYTPRFRFCPECGRRVEK